MSFPGDRNYELFYFECSNIEPNIRFLRHSSRLMYVCLVSSLSYSAGFVIQQEFSSLRFFLQDTREATESRPKGDDDIEFSID